MAEAIYKELSATLENWLREKHLSGKLPGLYCLSSMFGAHHATVRKAVELLVEKGKLEVIPSRGIFVVSKKRRPHTGMIGVVGLGGTEHFREQILATINAKLKGSEIQLMEIANNTDIFLNIRGFCCSFRLTGIFLSEVRLRGRF